MKLKLLAAALLSSAGLWAQSSRAWNVTVGTAGTTSAVVVQAKDHSLQVNVNSPSACAIQLEGSLDGVNWFNLSGSQSCMTSTLFSVTSKPVTYVRANLTSYTGANSVAIYYQAAVY